MNCHTVSVVRYKATRKQVFRVTSTDWERERAGYLLRCFCCLNLRSGVLFGGRLEKNARSQVTAAFILFQHSSKDSDQRRRIVGVKNTSLMPEGLWGL